MTYLQQARELRRKETAEDFTPAPLVSEMLDRLPLVSFTDPSKLFCDPAAGNGNFLVQVLARKLSHSHPPLQALSTVYGVELMDDNVEEMKERLLAVLLEAHPNLDESSIKEAKGILNHNIVCHDALTFDFENWKKVTKSKKLF